MTQGKHGTDVSARQRDAAVLEWSWRSIFAVTLSPATAYPKTLLASLLATLFWALPGCSDRGADAMHTPNCEPDGALRTICGIQSPEDLALLPDGSGLLLSEFGGVEGRPGRISLLDLRSEETRILYDADSANDLALAHNTWGDPECEQSDEFSPHGFDLAQRPGGRWQLLVVNHAGGESIEMFELLRGGGQWRLDWRGCATGPQGAQFNDVASTGAGFVVSEFSGDSRLRTLTALLFGLNNSRLWQWDLQHGFTAVPGLEGTGINGVASDNSSKRIYANDWGANKVQVYDRVSRAVIEEFDLPHVDNSNWVVDEPGKMLIASQRAGLFSLMRCTMRHNVNCPAAFSLFELDVSSMQLTEVFRSGGEYFGGGTAALRIDDTLYIGSFTGNRLLIAPVGHGVE